MRAISGKPITQEAFDNRASRSNVDEGVTVLNQLAPGIPVRPRQERPLGLSPSRWRPAFSAAAREVARDFKASVEDLLRSLTTTAGRAASRVQTTGAIANRALRLYNRFEREREKIESGAPACMSRSRFKDLARTTADVLAGLAFRVSDEHKLELLALAIDVEISTFGKPHAAFGTDIIRIPISAQWGFYCAHAATLAFEKGTGLRFTGSTYAADKLPADQVNVRDVVRAGYFYDLAKRYYQVIGTGPLLASEYSSDEIAQMKLDTVRAELVPVRETGESEPDELSDGGVLRGTPLQTSYRDKSYVLRDKAWNAIALDLHPVAMPSDIDKVLASLLGGEEYTDGTPSTIFEAEPGMPLALPDEPEPVR